MNPRPMTKADYDHIVTVIDDWSGGLSRNLAHPIFFHDLGGMNRVVDRGGELTAFLFGFLTPAAPPVGYVHLVGVPPDHRRSGTGRVLYEEFEAASRDHGCHAIKAITTLGNEGSLLFH